MPLLLIYVTSLISCFLSNFLFVCRETERRRWNFESPEVFCCFSFLKLGSWRVVVLGSVGNGDVGFMCNLSDRNFITFYFFRFCRFS